VEGDGFVVVDILFEALFEYFVFFSEFGEFVGWFAVAVLVVFRADPDMEFIFLVFFNLILYLIFSSVILLKLRNSLFKLFNLF